ncbi:MAG: tRNA (adenosine(37)-N6)-dimethylallyltransferase MiaA, partial [Chloroflexi bacterium]|nr:tRNA (adenosine(37)-N6)-dimethylallyltransferase MiaA [Chloroflexota bacterium]
TLPRNELYRRIDERVERMVEAGWIEEVRRLSDQGITADHPSMGSVGYLDIAAHIAGELALEEAIRNIKTSTHRFARRQYSWFRLSDHRIHWLQADADALEEQAVSLISGFIASNG